MDKKGLQPNTSPQNISTLLVFIFRKGYLQFAYEIDICILITKYHFSVLCFVYCCICISCNYSLQLYSKQNAVIRGEQIQNPTSPPSKDGCKYATKQQHINKTTVKTETAEMSEKHICVKREFGSNPQLRCINDVDQRMMKSIFVQNANLGLTHNSVAYMMMVDSGFESHRE